MPDQGTGAGAPTGPDEAAQQLLGHDPASDGRREEASPDAVRPDEDSRSHAPRDPVIIWSLRAAGALVLLCVSTALLLTFLVMRQAAQSNASPLALQLVIYSVAVYTGLAIAILGFALFLINARGSLVLRASKSAVPRVLGGVALGVNAPGIVALVCSATIISITVTRSWSTWSSSQAESSPATDVDRARLEGEIAELRTEASLSEMENRRHLAIPLQLLTRLRQPVGSLEFDAHPVEEVLEFLADNFDVGIVVDPRVKMSRGEDDLRVKIKVRPGDTTVYDVLDLLCVLCRLYWEFRNGMIFVTCAD